MKNLLLYNHGINTNNGPRSENPLGQDPRVRQAFQLAIDKSIIAQIVGKIRMALVPFRNHWWHVTLYVTDRGLSTGAMPAGDREAEIAFDLLRHRIVVTTSDGGRRELDLVARPACADVYTDLFAALAELGVDAEIHPEPFDLGESPAFHEDRDHRHYDPDAVHRYWRVLAMTQRVEALIRSAGQFAPATTDIDHTALVVAADTRDAAVDRWRPALRGAVTVLDVAFPQADVEACQRLRGRCERIAR